MLELLAGTYAVCRLPTGTPVDRVTDEFLVIIRSTGESQGTTLVCYEPDAPAGAEIDRGWHVIKIQGTFDFGEVGVLAAVLVPLAKAQVPALVMASFETDYVLVKAHRLDRVRDALTDAGHTLSDPAGLLGSA